MRALWIAAGVLVWALHFGALYGITAIACARGAPVVVSWSIAVATAIAVGMVIAIVASRYRARLDFIGWMTIAVAASALVAIVWEALPALWLPPCWGTAS